MREPLKAAATRAMRLGHELENDSGLTSTTPELLLYAWQAFFAFSREA